MKTPSVHYRSRLATFKTHFIGTPLKWVPLAACVFILFAAAVSVSTSATPEGGQPLLQPNGEARYGEAHENTDESTRPFVNQLAPQAGSPAAREMTAGMSNKTVLRSRAVSSNNPATSKHSHASAGRDTHATLQTVDINAATPALLAQQLKGIGPAKALAIVQYRESNGAFDTVEALVNVKGIGPKTLAKIRSQLVAGAYSPPKLGESLLEREAAARAAVQTLLQRSRERSRAAERAATGTISRAK